MQVNRDLVTERVHQVADGLTLLLDEARAAREARTEVGGNDGSTPTSGDSSGGTAAVCAWNHFENIPTFYNWNNRPR